MKTYRFTFAIAMMVATVAVNAQSSFDAAKLYDEELNGTARYVGMGGAMGALGNDMSVISHNPAGIGLYHNSDINMSISFFGNSVETDPLATLDNPVKAYNGIKYASHNNKSDVMPAIDNISMVFSGYDGSENHVNFGFAYRKLLNTDFNLDYFDDQPEPDDNGKTAQRDFQDRQRNKINSFDFNISCGLSDVLYLGWTVGLLTTDTWSEGYFFDYYPEDPSTNTPEEKIVAVEKMNTATGAGFNMAFGAVFRPIPALRIGVAAKSPTWFRQNLQYADFLKALPGKTFDGEKVTAGVKYRYTSPWSIDLSAGFTVLQTALGFEYERHFAGRSSLSIDNVQMLNQGAVDYKDYSLMRFGIEQNIGKVSLRAGYTTSGSMFKDGAVPYLNDSEYNQMRQSTDCQVIRPVERQNFSLGLGYCSEPDNDNTQFYFDMAFVHGIKNNEFNINEYYIESKYADPTVNYNVITNKLLVTVGWNF